MKFVLILLIFVAIVTSIEGAKILGIFHVPTRSHHIIGSTLLKGLAAKGHQVTMLSPYPLKEPVPNYRDLVIDGVHEILEEMRNAFFTSSWQNKLSMLSRILNFSNTIAGTTLNCTAVQNLLKSDETFDAIIMDSFGNEAFLGFGHHFKAQVIAMGTSNSQFVNHLTGNVAPFAFVPNILTKFTDKMTFLERMANTLIGTMFQVYGYILASLQDVQYKEHFKNGPDLRELVGNVSLVLVNSHVVLETPRPYLPNMIPVGGIHITEPKQLPQELQEYLNDAKEGVIYFSLGSNLKSSQLSEEKRRVILNTFAKLPQRVLWKFEDDSLIGKPQNLKIRKWFPQSDVLAHPNVKLFITHGGLLSCTEAVYRGVPVLGIPFYGDQQANAASFVSAGYGLSLTFDELTEETFTKVIQEILNNPKYQITMKQKSNIIRDQPISPLDNAIFWVEHVIRHGGGKHLRSSAVELSLVQYLLLDVMAFIAAVSGTFIIGLYFIIKKYCGFCKKKTSEILKQRKSKSKRA